MKFEWDHRKALSNLTKHKIAFEAVHRLEWDSVLEFSDPRHLPEVRTIAWGLISYRLHVLVYTLRGNTCRVISLRKANAREVDQYAEKKTH